LLQIPARAPAPPSKHLQPKIDTIVGTAPVFLRTLTIVRQLLHMISKPKYFDTLVNCARLPNTSDLKVSKPKSCLFGHSPDFEAESDTFLSPKYIRRRLDNYGYGRAPPTIKKIERNP
jgi:hypothetical protein